MARRQKNIENVDALITGFPGFLATYLFDELLPRQPKATFHVLVQKRFVDLAHERIAELTARHPTFSGSFEVVVGDITDPLLDLDEATYRALAKRVGVVWHLAAIYDLAVPEQLAFAVNVEGTHHILDFCEACTSFRRLNYVSTCYVSGELRGTVYEDELDQGQSHHNHYESTKFWAEVEVQRRMDKIATTIFRPSIVVGNSRTGETDKYDGPYYLLKMLRKYPNWLPFPNIGEGEFPVNIIPIDFVVQVMATLGLRDAAAGEVYHVADPNPMRARDIVSLALQLMDKAPARGKVPPRLLDVVLENERLEESLGIPRQVVRYFTQSVRYDTTRCSEALADTDIACPHLSTYLQTLIDYVDLHPEKDFLDRRRV